MRIRSFVCIIVMLICLPVFSSCNSITEASPFMETTESVKESSVTEQTAAESIFSKSSERYLTQVDLLGMSKDMLRRGADEISARSRNSFNEYEKENLAFIQWAEDIGGIAADHIEIGVQAYDVAAGILYYYDVEWVKDIDRGKTLGVADEDGAGGYYLADDYAIYYPNKILREIKLSDDVKIYAEYAKLGYIPALQEGEGFMDRQEFASQVKTHAGDYTPDTKFYQYGSTNVTLTVENGLGTYIYWPYTP